MKKTIFLILLLISFSKASYLIKTVDDDFLWVRVYCADNISYPSTTHIKFYDNEISSNRTITLTSLSSIDIKNGYRFINGSCSQIPLSETYGLPYEQFNFLMAQFGLVVVFLFGLTFLTGL